MARFTRVHVRLDLVFPQKFNLRLESVVFCHEQVEVRVVVDVHPGGSPAELVQGQVVFGGFLGELAIFLLDKSLEPNPSPQTTCWWYKSWRPSWLKSPNVRVIASITMSVPRSVRRQ